MFGGITQVSVASSAIARLQALRRALDDVQDMNAWLAGQSPTDLSGIGFSSQDAGSLKSAFADAGALWQLYNQGTVPGSYPQPASTYVYGASQRQVLGPA